MATKTKKTETKAKASKAKAIEKTLTNHPTLGLVAKEPHAARKPKSAKPAKTAPKEGGKLSCLDAAAKVLGEKKEPMTTGEMIEAMAAKKLWTSPGGKTPAATLYSAILRELGKGKESRFKKTERGKFALNG